MNNMEYTFDNIRKAGMLLYEYMRGSHAYGLNTETSDVDSAAVYLMDKDSYLSILGDYTEQVADERNDTVWYELGRYLELLCKSNPNMVEGLFVPDRCVRYTTPAFEELKKHRNMFLTKDLVQSIVGFAQSQIHKARGLNKKIVNPVTERKNILDFCYTFKGQGTEPFLDFLNRNGLKPRYCGLVHLPNMDQMYDVHYDFGQHFKEENITSHADMPKELYDYISFGFVLEDPRMTDNFIDSFVKQVNPVGYRGAIDENNETTQLRMSSVEKGSKCICHISFNENGYKTHCKQYREYQEWVEKRNPQRYLENKEKDYDRKNMTHCIRLLTMAIETAKTGEFNVDRTDSDRDFLLSIRTGNRTYEEVLQYAENKQKELDEVIENCKLPQSVDRKKVKRLLLKIRTKYYNL